jgi:hypothetical protein
MKLTTMGTTKCINKINVLKQNFNQTFQQNKIKTEFKLLHQPKTNFKQNFTRNMGLGFTSNEFEKWYL